MALKHIYLGIEDINLNSQQRGQLIAALRELGPDANPSPARLLHYRLSTDGRKALFEALFDEAHLTIQAFKNRLAAIFGVGAATINHTVSSVTFDTLPTPIVVFSRNGTDYLRFALFGGAAASWAESGTEARAYIAANREEWE